jgi:hypothetical protein
VVTAGGRVGYKYNLSKNLINEEQLTYVIKRSSMRGFGGWWGSLEMVLKHGKYGGIKRGGVE